MFKAWLKFTFGSTVNGRHKYLLFIAVNKRWANLSVNKNIEIRKIKKFCLSDNAKLNTSHTFAVDS